MMEETTKNEILKAINDFSTNKVEATMVTKDYLDDKLSDLRGDLVVLMRKEDKKLQLFSLEPFPQLFVSK